MWAQIGGRGLAVFLVMIALLSPIGGGGQSLPGSVVGRLTDTHSSPLEHVTITLRNVVTGAAFHGTTSRGGRYGFRGLSEGEYTLSATGPQGSGEVGGIVVSPGHESQVQAVIEFRAQPSLSVRFEPPVVTGTKDPTDEMILREVFARLRRKFDTASQPEILQASFPLASLETLQLTNSTQTLFHSVASMPDVAPVQVPLPTVHAELESIRLFTLPDSALNLALPSKAVVELDAIGTEQRGVETLEGSQLESLPLVTGVTDLIVDHRQSPREEEVRHGASMESRSHVVVDGLRLRSSFDGVRRSGSPDFATGASAIDMVQAWGVEETPSLNLGRSAIRVYTRRGSDQLHGKVSLFTRQRLLAAQNPLLQWVKESAPGSALTIPAFTGQPFTPSNAELQWGAALGGPLPRSRWFWFAALDGYDRQDPAIAAVRHPDNFFAQPSNDQMQLLSAQLDLGGIDQISKAVSAYSKLLESLAGLLGPAPRSSRQRSGFGRLDWRSSERLGFTLEGSGQKIHSPGGGFSREWQTYGRQSLGSLKDTSGWLLGRSDSAVRPNLLMATQGWIGRRLQRLEPEKPSEFEQLLNINAWGQLPQILVDSRDGFTIGNPARFGQGKFPDQGIFGLEQRLQWRHGNLVVNLGGELDHETDATTRLRNQNGTYFYSSIEDFASDALTFFEFGLNGQLNPNDQHNCDQRGRSWRDTSGVLHGLGYLPCYSYYSQTMGPSNWWISTNDWAGYATSQWRTGKRAVFTTGMRWELQQLPRPLRKLENPDLPIAGRLPDLGNQWGPRAGFALGSGESRWPVLRAGYGMYFGRTPNVVMQAALTQTGSRNGDLSFFMRPTDNLNGGGAPPFPYVLSEEPGSMVKPAAMEFASSFRNGEAHEADISLEETLPGRAHLEVSGIASLARRLPVTTDANIDTATNPKIITYAIVDGNGSGPIKAPQITVPFFASWPSAGAAGGRLNSNYQQISEIFSGANSTYKGLAARLTRNASGITFRVRYAFGRAADWNPDESPQLGGPSVLDPTDFRQEYGTSDLDVRHSVRSAVVLRPKWKLHGNTGIVANGWMLSGVGHFNSGSPYTMRTAGSLAKEFNQNGQVIVALSTGMNGYGGDNRVYGVGRNTFRYPATWKADLRVAKRFGLGQMRQLELMAESFNLFNHQNVTQVETVGYSIEQGTVNGALPRLSFLTGLKSGQTEFGKPLDINATDLYRQRQFQFGARMQF